MNRLALPSAICHAMVPDRMSQMPKELEAEGLDALYGWRYALFAFALHYIMPDESWRGKSTASADILSGPLLLVLDSRLSTYFYDR